MAAVELKYEKAKVGMRVQDYWGSTGVIRWMGKIDKKDLAPNREIGHYFGIEYDEKHTNPLRCNGTFKGKTYFECDAQRGMLCRAHDFIEERNGVCVAELRAQFGDRVKSWHDFELVKFCIARKFNMEKVKEMLEKHLDWRESFQPSSDEYFLPEIAEDYPCGYSGATDYEGNLIYCERPSNGGHCHPSDFVKKYTLPVIARWHACGVEMGMNRLRATNYVESKRVCIIVDLLNVNAMTRPMISFAQTLASVEQDNYPENVGKVFIVNCPAFFRFAWRLVKIFLDERTNKKIHFVAPKKAAEVLREHMREEDIPDFCGGPSTAWRETNGSRLGSMDPAKAYQGPLPEVRQNSHLEELQEQASAGGSPIEMGDANGALDDDSGSKGECDTSMQSMPMTPSPTAPGSPSHASLRTQQLADTIEVVQQ